MEVPGISGLAGSTAEAVARGLGRAQTSSRQPLSGLRPLGLRMEVCYSFLIVGSEPLVLFFCWCLANFFDSVFDTFVSFFYHLAEPKFSNKHNIRCPLKIVGSGVGIRTLLNFFLSDLYYSWIRILKFSGPGILICLKLYSYFQVFFYFHYFSLIYLCFAQASGFSAPGAVGGLPEERGGAAEEVATGSGTNSGSSAPAPAPFHLGEVKFSGSICVSAGPHLPHRCLGTSFWYRKLIIFL